MQTTEPKQIIAGDTVKWSKTFPDYPASQGWALSYALVKTGARIQITATPNVDEFIVTLNAATTAGYAPGIYHWQSYMTVSGERFSIETGTIEVKPDFLAQTTGFDARSHVKRVLDALEATILNKASVDQLSYSIAGRSLSRMSPEELLKWRNQYRAEYRNEQRKTGTGRSRLIKVRF